MTPLTDPRYVVARRVLLDALKALASHRKAFIVAGAQAVYLRTGPTDIGIAPYTTDGDLALDPSLLSDEPELEATMRSAGFDLLERTPNHPEPGIWIARVSVDGEEVLIPVDLIVPEGVAAGGGRRGARLGPHGKRAARRVVGLEAALVDHSPMEIASLDPADVRVLTNEVAGPAALFVAKAHKLHDRLTSSRASRLDDKDAADVYRLMQTTPAVSVAATFTELRAHPTAGPPTEDAIEYLTSLFSRRRSEGVSMAVRALRLAVPEPQVRTFATSYLERLLAELE